jgi:osmotically inducible protein OsmC
MAAIRRAEANWSGALVTGAGTVTAVSSAAFSRLPVSWAARTEASSGELVRAGTPPDRLDVSAAVTFDKVEAGWRVVSSALTVHGWVPGATDAGFLAAAEATRDGCPISQALKGNVALSVEATLEA